MGLVPGFAEVRAGTEVVVAGEDVDGCGADLACPENPVSGDCLIVLLVAVPLLIFFLFLFFLFVRVLLRIYRTLFPLLRFTLSRSAIQHSRRPPNILPSQFVGQVSERMTHGTASVLQRSDMVDRLPDIDRRLADVAVPADDI